MKYAIVKFLSSKDDSYSQGYNYKNTVKAKPYDAVIVPTRYGLSLAVVESVTDEKPEGLPYGCEIKAISEVVQSEAVAKEMSAQKKKDLKKQLEKEVKKLDDIERFKMYAKNNPAFAELLEQYEAL